MPENLKTITMKKACKGTWMLYQKSHLHEYSKHYYKYLYPKISKFGQFRLILKFHPDLIELSHPYTCFMFNHHLIVTFHHQLDFKSQNHVLRYSPVFLNWWLVDKDQNCKSEQHKRKYILTLKSRISIAMGTYTFKLNHLHEMKVRWIDTGRNEFSRLSPLEAAKHKSG